MSDTNSYHFCADDRLVQVNGNYISRPFFTNLLNGATLCPLDLREVGIHQLATWLIKHEITIYRAFPGAFRSFVSLLSGRERFLSLRLVRLAGEPLYRSDVELFKKYFSSDCVLNNAYASTETGLICSYYLDKFTKIIGHRVPVGYPVVGKDVSIADAEAAFFRRVIGNVARKPEITFNGRTRIPKLASIARAISVGYPPMVV
jgi:acyl-coenzyme A synthetase/AMP-(fatty) acid ligase